MSFTLSSPLILGSNSPRRKEILEKSGFKFEVESKDTLEDFLVSTPINEIAGMLAERKNRAFETINDRLLLTADTVVCIHNTILNKPKNEKEAKEMLKLLSGQTHEVHTAFCFSHNGIFKTKTDTCKVSFKPISSFEIDYYITNYRPFDKAGSYGVQDFLGMAFINKIEGSFYTVMGLPIHLVYEELKPFIILN